MPLMKWNCGAYGDPALKKSESKSVTALRSRVPQDERASLTSDERLPSVFARRHGFSVRYLHRLFQMRSQSLMGFVGQVRTALCQRLVAGSNDYTRRATHSKLPPAVRTTPPFVGRSASISVAA